MTRFIRVAVVGVASLLFLAACGGDDETPSSGGTTSPAGSASLACALITAWLLRHDRRAAATCV